MTHAIDCTCGTGRHDPRCAYLRVVQPPEPEPRKRAVRMEPVGPPPVLAPTMEALRLTRTEGIPWP